MPDYVLECAAGKRVAGVDEAGRGPWAGPVVAAAVILTPGSLPEALVRAIDDSKRLTKTERERLFTPILDTAYVGVGAASAKEIDRLNILQATLLAMTRAIGRLPVLPDAVLIDGNRGPVLSCPSQCVVGGDGRSLSIAAASIIAKVIRDRLMAALGRRYAGYGWDRNAGYGTRDHRAALSALGVTPHHRRSFRPIAECIREKAAASESVTSKTQSLTPTTL